MFDLIFPPSLCQCPVARPYNIVLSGHGAIKLVCSFQFLSLFHNVFNFLFVPRFPTFRNLACSFCCSSSVLPSPVTVLSSGFGVACFYRMGISCPAVLSIILLMPFSLFHVTLLGIRSSSFAASVSVLHVYLLTGCLCGCFPAWFCAVACCLVFLSFGFEYAPFCLCCSSFLCLAILLS